VRAHCLALFDEFTTFHAHMLQFMSKV